MSIGSRIKEARNNKKLTQPQLAQLVGVSSGAIGNYESGKSSPRDNILYRIMEVLNVDANFIFQDEMRAFKEERLSSTENALIKKYRALDEHGTKAVDCILDLEYERCTAKPTVADYPFNIIPFSLIPASAGTGEWLDDESMDEIEIPDTAEYRQADFAVQVSGDSMEPTYHDGDIVLVHRQDAVNIGDIGIFIVDGQGYIKEQGESSLISHNVAYDDIRPSRDAYVKCFGKVIGKL